jgi:hypothetical protein
VSAVLLAVYNHHEAAQRVRVVLIRDGFPTDRVDLTASNDLGRAGMAPAHSPYGKCVQYFRMLLRRPDERHYPEILARRVEDGAATITVLPRGAIETARAREILQHAQPVEVFEHDLASEGWVSWCAGIWNATKCHFLIA